MSSYTYTQTATGSPTFNGKPVIVTGIEISADFITVPVVDQNTTPLTKIKTEQTTFGIRDICVNAKTTPLEVIILNAQAINGLLSHPDVAKHLASPMDQKAVSSWIERLSTAKMEAASAHAIREEESRRIYPERYASINGHGADLAVETSVDYETGKGRPAAHRASKSAATAPAAE